MHPISGTLFLVPDCRKSPGPGDPARALGPGGGSGGGGGAGLGGGGGAGIESTHTYTTKPYITLKITLKHVKKFKIIRNTEKQLKNIQKKKSQPKKSKYRHSSTP